MARAIRTAMFDHGTNVETEHLSSFDNRMCSSPSSSGGRRFLLVSCHNESDEVLPTDAAMGHIIVTAWLSGEQYFWCNICSAYTGERVCKLTKQCDRIVRNAPLLERLRMRLHLVHGSHLVVRPRRLLKRDVGSRLSCLEGSSTPTPLCPCMLRGVAKLTLRLLSVL